MKDTVDAFAEILTLEGATDGPLAGLTFGAKDLFDVAGRVAGCGNPEWARTHEVASTNAPAVSALLEGGAKLVGMTHTDELAYSLMGVNTHYGTPVNTADPRRVPGGSSSGSASAVAAGLVDLGLGSDTGGSVRLPAAFCGVWGIRTTFGLLPLDDAMPFTHSFDTVGWFARDSATMALAAQAYGCPDGPAPTRLLLPVDAWARADAATIAAVTPTLAQLQAHLGPAEPVLLAPDGLDTWREIFRICQAFEIWEVHGDWVSTHSPDFGPGIRERFEIASKIDSAAFETAKTQKAAVQERIARILSPETVLVFPTGPGPAPLKSAPEETLNDFRMRAFEMLCPAGLAGLPQLSIPAGTVDQGPVGLSLVGTTGQDRQLIALAADALRPAAPL
jgi:amidase